MLFLDVTLTYIDQNFIPPSMFLLHHFQNFPLQFNFHIVSSYKLIFSQWLTWSSCRYKVSKIVHITRNKWYRLTETDLEQVGDLDSNIHQSCCQRLCTLNQPVCNNEWEHTVTIVEFNYNLLQHLLFHHVLFCKCFSYVLLSTPLQLHSSVQHKKHAQYTVNDECMKREYNPCKKSSQQLLIATLGCW